MKHRTTSRSSGGVFRPCQGFCFESPASYASFKAHKCVIQFVQGVAHAARASPSMRVAAHFFIDMDQMTGKRNLWPKISHGETPFSVLRGPIPFRILYCDIRRLVSMEWTRAKWYRSGIFRPCQTSVIEVEASYSGKESMAT